MSVEISQLNISESWKQKFSLIEKAGGPELPYIKNLEFNERIGLKFNIVAFIFGPLYYVAKGLWRQAIVYLLLSVALGFLLEALGFHEIAKAVGYFFAAIFGLRANTSYYKKIVLCQTSWV
ncbi:MAG: DUF2628 domain-containing protein [Deltaproteobacteria bacterium]|nr:DUF2628 domain-containing protein [Deltaproteobacteria bacterium]